MGISLRPSIFANDGNVIQLYGKKSSVNEYPGSRLVFKITVVVFSAEKPSHTFDYTLVLPMWVVNSNATHCEDNRHYCKRSVHIRAYLKNCTSDIAGDIQGSAPNVASVNHA